MQIIPVCFTFDKNFVVPAAVAIFSLLEYANKQYYYHLYVLHVDISNEDQLKLQNVVARFHENSSLEFINVEKYHDRYAWTELKSKQHYSKEIYNKLILDQIFPQYDRMICTDVDVVFRGDVSESFFMFPEDTFYVAGIRSMNKNSIIDWYIGSFSLSEQEILSNGIGAGYFLLNLSQIRKNGIGEKMCIAYKENLHRLIQPEQDIINLCCYPFIRYMPFNYMVCTYYYSINKNEMKLVDELVNIQPILDSPVQIHYAGYNKPWNSFFCTKGSAWFKTLFDAGFLFEYIKMVPYYMMKRIKKYSIRRFLGKVKDFCQK